MTGSKSNVVVVTGASGFIGRYCCNHLASSGFDVIRVGRASSDDVYCDLECLDSLCSLNSLPAYKAFIHLGAHVGWDGSPLQDMFLPNIVSTALIADITRKHGAHLVFASAAIIAGLNTEDISASSVDNPDTLYAKSKELAEQCLSASGVSAAILRVGGVYGLNGPCHLGLNRTIKAALKGETPVIYGSGSGKRNYIYVEDLASIIVATVQAGVTGTHLVSGHEVLSIVEMYQLICESFDLSSPLLLQTGDSSRSQIVSALPRFTGKSSFSESLMTIRQLSCNLPLMT